jgi:hypothetical protein
MKIHWKYRYVPEGQMEPDEINRWAVDAHIKVPSVAVKGFDKFPVETLIVRVATIVQKGTRNGSVPSIVDKFCCTMPVLSSLRLSNQYNLFSNDLEELKSQVEEKLNQLKHIFNSAE